MGMELVVQCAQVDFAALVALLAGRGQRGMVAMVDGALHPPGTPIPDTWRDVRLRLPAGTVTVARRTPGQVAVVVFGNADPALQAAQRQVSDAIAELAQA